MRLSDLLTSAAINLAIACGFLTLFSFLRKQPFNARVYFPRLFLRDKEYAKNIRYDFKTFLPTAGWLQKAIAVPEAEILRDSGLDSVVFLRLFTFSLKLFATFLFVGFAILLPVNATDNYIEKHPELKLDNLDKLSLGNVTPGSGRLWAHCICTYVVTFLTFFFLYKEFYAISELRHRFLMEVNPSPDQFTVLVRQIPDMEGESLGETVDRFFSTNHPYTYLSHQLVYKDGEILSLMNKRDGMINKIDRLRLQKEGAPERQFTTKTGTLGLRGERVDSFEFYGGKVEELADEIRSKQTELRGADDKAAHAAFVTFKSRCGQVVCAQTQQTRVPTQWTTEWAPEPRDVVWVNLGIPWMQFGPRGWLTSVVLFFTIFFYLIPVGFVQGLTELDKLKKYLPFAKGIIDVPVISQLIQGFLPGLALTIFLVILPSFTMLLSKIEGHPSKSSLQIKSAGKMFYFQVVNVFFGSILAGSILNQLVGLVSEPKEIPNKLGGAIPGKANFFITYIMVSGWAGFPSEILRLLTLGMYHGKSSLNRHKTEKDKETLMNIQSPSYHQILPGLMLFILVGMVYVIVSPVLLPFLVVYFALGYAVYKHQILNVYEPEYETGGQFWPFIFRRIIASLILMQITMIGVLGLKKAKVAAPLLIPLPFLTLAFFNMCQARFLPAFLRYSVESAMRKDISDREKGTTVDETFLRTAYLYPPLEVLEEGNAASSRGGDAYFSDDGGNFGSTRTHFSDGSEEFSASGRMDLADRPADRPASPDTRPSSSRSREEIVEGEV